MCCACHSGTLNVSNETLFIKECVGMSQASTLDENSPYIEMNSYAYAHQVSVLLGFMCHASVLIVGYSHHITLHQE